MKKIVLLSLTILLAAACSTKTAPHPDKQYEALVNAVYDRLSVEDRAAQLFGIYPGELMVDGVFSLEKCQELIPYGAGHICQLSSSQSPAWPKAHLVICKIKSLPRTTIRLLG